MPERRDEIAAALGDVRARVRTACDSAGRDPGDVTLVVVTKTFGVSDIVDLLGLGVADIGENRDQEARAKVAQLREHTPSHAEAAPRWHFIGQLQRNKANSVARYADFVHSVDRVALAGALERGAGAADRHLECFVQVSLDPDATGVIGPRGGAVGDEILSVCEAVVQAEHLTLRGLMAVAPLGEPPSAAFGRLAQLHGTVMKDFPQASALSAGMSHDFEEAIANGATHVRVGSAVLGERSDVR